MGKKGARTACRLVFGFSPSGAYTGHIRSLVSEVKMSEAEGAVSTTRSGWVMTKVRDSLTETGGRPPLQPEKHTSALC